MEPTGRFSKVSAGKSKSQKKKSQGWKIKRMMEKCFFLISDCFNVVLLNSFLWLTSQCSLSSHFIQFHAPTSLHFLLFFVFASFGLNCKCVRVVILRGGGGVSVYRIGPFCSGSASGRWGTPRCSGCSPLLFHLVEIAVKAAPGATDSGWTIPKNPRTLRCPGAPPTRCRDLWSGDFHWGGRKRFRRAAKCF